jgi:hypothetical protein
MPGRAVMKPTMRRLEELQEPGRFQLREYRQKNVAMFCDLSD